MNQFVRQRLELNRRMEAAALRPIRIPPPSKAPTELASLRKSIIARQAIGDPPRAANDNRHAQRVRKSTGKFVRGAFADALPVVLQYRNTPDHKPEPVTSSWSTEPIAPILAERDEDGEPIIASAEDRSLEIRPSIGQIMAQVRTGEVTRSSPKLHPKGKNKGKPVSRLGPIVKIGKLIFSDGEQRERIHMRCDAGIVFGSRKARAGTMLNTTERLAGGHGGESAAVASMSNTRTVALFFGVDENDKPNNWRAFIPGGTRRTGRNLSSEQSRALIAQAVANTPNMPSVTLCPPGVASGTARFSDQFVGLVSGSTGNGGAPNWVDVAVAIEDHSAWMASVAELDAKSAIVLEVAQSAGSLADVGVAVGQAVEYARRQGGKRALIAANDNFAEILRNRA